ncbi:MAG: CDP-alcohol phosphatidyltransferase family protein [Rhodospirillales bacterium]|nr:CDP-alcohol phosphatidyltransferase family protein [Rhodospirillales bacterium]
MAASAIPLFPVVRHLSKYVTPMLVALPVTANQVTTASLLAGLAACWSAAQGTHGWAVVSGVLMVVCYVLDNCDGEVARQKNQCSTFGMHYDTFVDWAVHAAFFVTLGIGAERLFSSKIWFYMGLIAAAGATVNYVLGLVFDARERQTAAAMPAAAASKEYRQPDGWTDYAVYVFRELTRADFCFIVLILAAFDLLWILVPAGAVGSQVYWITQFVRGARDFHV